MQWIFFDNFGLIVCRLQEVFSVRVHVKQRGAIMSVAKGQCHALRNNAELT
jgi:hypothetical protein